MTSGDGDCSCEAPLVWHQVCAHMDGEAQLRAHTLRAAPPVTSAGASPQLVSREGTLVAHHRNPGVVAVGTHAAPRRRATVWSLWAPHCFCEAVHHNRLWWRALRATAACGPLA